MHSRGNTFTNAVVGAVVALVLVVVPFSPAVGGAAAGYLQRGPITDGAKAGVVTGLLVTVPLFVGVTALAPILLFAPAGIPNVPMNVTLYVLLASTATATYALGAGTIGGAVGAYLAAVRHADDVALADAGVDDDHAPAVDD